MTGSDKKKGVVMVGGPIRYKTPQLHCEEMEAMVLAGDGKVRGYRMTVQGKMLQIESTYRSIGRKINIILG